MTETDPDWSPYPIDLLIGYTPGTPLPQRGFQWHPEMGKRYRKRTEVGYWTWRASMTIGDRWRRQFTKVSRGLKNREKLNEGRAIVARLISQGKLDMSDVPMKDEARAEEALSYCVALVKDEDADHKHRLSAANTVLSFLKAKPVVKTETTIKSAEDFLDALD